MADNFGRPKMVPAVEEICVAVPFHKCDKCGTACDNDYWHKNYIEFLCHMCMEEEKILHEKYIMKQLKQYEKIRTCSYKHSHEGTSAAVLLIPKPKLAVIERVENYLNLFIKSF